MGQMILEKTTIVALCTPPMMGALAVIRLSGTEALDILSKVWKGKAPDTFNTHTAHLGYITSKENKDIDQVVAAYFKAPASFTGEETIEISCHGSVWIQQAIINRLIECGATPAGPGEFSQRALPERTTRPCRSRSRGRPYILNFTSLATTGNEPNEG